MESFHDVMSETVYRFSIIKRWQYLHRTGSYAYSGVIKKRLSNPLSCKWQYRCLFLSCSLYKVVVFTFSPCPHGFLSAILTAAFSSRFAYNQFRLIFQAQDIFMSFASGILIVFLINHIYSLFAFQYRGMLNAG